MAKKPILGRLAPGTDCGRTIYGGLCGKPGYHHIIWGKFSSFCCRECLVYLNENSYDFIESHPIVPGCSNPLALWFPGEHTCRLPTAGDTSGVVVLG